MTGITEKTVIPSSLAGQTGLFLQRGLGLSLAALVPYLTFSYTWPTLIMSDRWLDMVALGMAVVFGLGGAIYWTTQKNSIDSERVQDVLRLIIRYFLAYVFIFYSFAKFYRSQLYEPFLSWQDTPLGDLTGFQLTWSFFGSSYPYAIFIGLSQLVCSALLLFRRTWLAGAVMLLPIIGNIVFVNFAYDIPVKLYSSIFLAMAGYLVLTRLNELLGLFFAQRQANPLRISNRTRYACTGLLAALMLGSGVLRFHGIGAISPPPDNSVHGVWEVISPEHDGDIPAQESEAVIDWNKLIFEWQRGGQLAILKTDVGERHASFTTNPVDSTLRIEFAGGAKKSFTGRYHRIDYGKMVLSGTLGEHPVQIDLKLVRR